MRECPLWGKEEIPGNRIGITLIRHKELIHQLSEIIVTSGTGLEISTSPLIDTIADEPAFPKKIVFILLWRNAQLHAERSEGVSPPAAVAPPMR